MTFGKLNLFAAAALLLLLGLALYLPGQRSLPVTDRDEARYAQASRQMVETGDYLRIRFLDKARNKKPAGIYWLQAAAVRLTGEAGAIWPYRLPSLGAALAAVLLLFALARRVLPAQAAWAAAAFASSPLLVVVAHSATTDAVLLITVCVSQSCLALVYLARPDGRPSGLKTLAPALGFWVALGAGILVKGPITPIIAALTVLALCFHDRDARWLRRLWPALGVPVLVLIVLPWLLAIQHATNGAFLHESLGQDFLAKAQSVRESHGAPPGYYLLGANLLLWPLLPLVWRGLGRAWIARYADPVAAFLLAWVIPAWTVFEFVPTKLPHYVLPFYPALLLLALRDAGGAEPAGCLWRVTCRIADGAWWLVAVLWVAVPLTATWAFGPAAWPAAAGCAAVALAATAWMRRERLRGDRQPEPTRSAQRQVAAGVVFAALYFGLLFGGVLPRLDDLWLTSRVAAMVAAHTPANAGHKPVASVGYEEPSVAFQLGSTTRLGVGVAGAVALLQQEPSAFVLVQDAPLPVAGRTWLDQLNALCAIQTKGCNLANFLAAAERAGVRVRELAAAEGWNYSRTKRVRVLLFSRAEATP